MLRTPINLLLLTSAASASTLEYFLSLLNQTNGTLDNILTPDIINNINQYTVDCPGGGGGSGGANQDPHLSFKNNGVADFRGIDKAYWNFLSTKDVSVAVRTEEAIFKLHELKVNGSFLTEVHWAMRTDQGRWFNVSMLAKELNDANWGWRMVKGACAAPGAPPKQGAFTMWKGRSTECDNLKASIDVATLLVETPEWEFKVRGSRVFDRIAGPHHRLDLSFTPLLDDSMLSVAPHGIIGQSFDGSNTPRMGRTDIYPDERVAGEFTTTAMAEGALEGDALDYRLAGPFETAFRYSRFDAPPRHAVPHPTRRPSSADVAGTARRLSGDSSCTPTPQDCLCNPEHGRDLCGIELQFYNYRVMCSDSLTFRLATCDCSCSIECVSNGNCCADYQDNCTYTESEYIRPDSCHVGMVDAPDSGNVTRCGKADDSHLYIVDGSGNFVPHADHCHCDITHCSLPDAEQMCCDDYVTECPQHANTSAVVALCHDDYSWMENPVGQEICFHPYREHFRAELTQAGIDYTSYGWLNANLPHTCDGNAHISSSGLEWLPNSTDPLDVSPTVG